MYCHSEVGVQQPSSNATFVRCCLWHLDPYHCGPRFFQLTVNESVGQGRCPMPRPILNWHDSLGGTQMHHEKCRWLLRRKWVVSSLQNNTTSLETQCRLAVRVLFKTQGHQEVLRCSVVPVMFSSLRISHGYLTGKPCFPLAPIVSMLTGVPQDTLWEHYPCGCSEEERSMVGWGAVRIS